MTRVPASLFATLGFMHTNFYMDNAERDVLQTLCITDPHITGARNIPHTCTLIDQPRLLSFKRVKEEGVHVELNNRVRGFLLCGTQTIKLSKLPISLMFV